MTYLDERVETRYPPLVEILVREEGHLVDPDLQPVSRSQERRTSSVRVRYTVRRRRPGEKKKGGGERAKRRLEGLGSGVDVKGMGCFTSG